MNWIILYKDTLPNFHPIVHYKLKKTKDFPVSHDSVTFSVVDPFIIGEGKNLNNTEHTKSFYSHWERIKIKENRKIDFFSVKTIQPEKISVNNSDNHYFEGKSDWIIGIVVFLVLLVAILRMFYGKILNQTFKSTVNIQSARKLISEKSNLIQKASFILMLIYLFGTGLFVFECFNFYRLTVFDFSGFVLFLTCFICVLFFYLIKALLYWITGVIIRSESEINETLSNYNIFYRTLGILLLPIIIAIPYVPDSTPEILIYCGLALFLTSFILRIIRGFVISFKMKLSLFYSFLYFCVLEILPLLYLFKVYNEMI